MQRLRRYAMVAAAVVTVAMVAAACSSSPGSGGGGSSNGVPLTGAGSTFAQPFYALWAQDFNAVESGAKVNYQAIGSGGGIQQFTSKTVDFGATDVPLQPDEAAAIKSPYIQFPTALGAVVVAYNVPGLPTGLKLDGSTVADIFLGKIKNWNDAAIASQNPGVKLPSMAIQVVHRADESGTTAIFTGWLSLESPTWKSQVGASKAVQWPTGTGGNGNAGVAAAMSQTKGSIGYLEYQYAVTTKIGVAQVKAPDGTYMSPSIAGITKAAQGLSFPISATTNILDSKVPGAYPISSTTYILIYKAQTNQATAQTLVDFWYWSLTKGQAVLGQLNYAPLPTAIQQDALQQLGEITYNGKTVTPSAKAK